MWGLPCYQPLTLLLGQAHDTPTPHCLGYLYNALCAFASPDHQCSHEQRDGDGEHDERAEDAVGRVPQCSARDGAFAEVVMVDSDEEFVHFWIGPETANLVCHMLGAVSQLPVAPVGTKKKRGCQGTQLGLSLV